MKRRFLLLLCFILMLVGMTQAASAEEQPGDSGESVGAEDDDDDGKDDEEDKWGENKLDHKLNVTWDYPADYVARPLVFNRLVTNFGAAFDYKFADQYFDADGDLVRGSFDIAKQTIRVFFGIGITDRFSFTVSAPFSYKKTVIRRGNQNYIPGGDNVYGVLLEEALVDYFTIGDGWDWWNFEWPWLGDIDLGFTYAAYQRLEPWTTSIAVESNPKFATGNDNLRRGSEPRNNIASGVTDWYNGVAVKQQVWKFSFLGRAGYVWRLASDTKYATGKIDMADQVRAYGEVMFQVPELKVFEIPGAFSVFPTWAIGTGFRYWTRIGESSMDPVRGRTEKLQDDGGYLMEIAPKLVYQVSSTMDLTFDVLIPLAGEKSFLQQTRSFYVPPYEIESYDAVGVTYSFGISKRFQ